MIFVTLNVMRLKYKDVTGRIRISVLKLLTTEQFFTICPAERPGSLPEVIEKLLRLQSQDMQIIVFSKNK